jgi:hypothetical protein
MNNKKIKIKKKKTTVILSGLRRRKVPLSFLLHRVRLLWSTWGERGAFPSKVGASRDLLRALESGGLCFAGFLALTLAVQLCE